LLKINLTTFLFFTTGFFSLWAQQVKLSGTVQDSLQTPLPYVNIIASPLAENTEITFAISGNKGQYELKLAKNTAYKLEITHLGYSKLTDTVSLDSDTVKNYILYESAQSLEEVLIEAEMAVIVKEDTITYRVDNFRTGEERKLKELLEKLPGVEVDRAGNVTVNGKKVTKLLVEGKEFFTGDEKLEIGKIKF